MLKFVVFIFLINIVAYENVEIKAEIEFCKKTDDLFNVISLDEECENLIDTDLKLVCASFINTINLLRDSAQNEIKMIYAMLEKKAFYFSNKQMFNARCSKISAFEIIESTDICTRELKVRFKIDGQYINGYLTRDAILVEESIEIECISGPKNGFEKAAGDLLIFVSSL